MEVIKKTIYQITTTGTTTGCTGTCRIIIPDTGITYTIKILFTQECDDIGFFDPYNFTGITGTSVNCTPYVVTGECISRLNELRKYSITNVFNNQYVGNGSDNNDGVDYINSISGETITYYLGGIKYIDIITGTTSGTTFEFIGQGLCNPDYINKPIYKNPDKENIISNPKINDDVFIIRQEISAFDKNYRLEYIKNLVDLETYAGGKFFNIFNNT